MAVYMFPGQGSQAKGMGIDVFRKFPEHVQNANQILGYSIEDLCLNDAEQHLANTKYTQPALYIVEVLSFLAKRDSLSNPEYCIGHSLGEYVALFAAGAFDFATGLQMVKKRGELMSQAQDGAMLAVINLAPERIKELLETNGLHAIDFANYNSNKQIVISGRPQDITAAHTVLSKEAMMCMPLKVSGAFHSRYMEDAANEFAQFLEPLQLSPLKLKVIANVTAAPYSDNEIKELLVKQITHPVKWIEIIRYLKQQGQSEFVEIGPGNVLTRLLAQN